MSRPFRLLSLIALTLLLTACGGGSGGEGDPDTHTVSTSAGDGGAISPASATVDDGATASFTVTPDTGYSIVNVVGCGGSLSGNTYTTGAVTAACTVTASFAALPAVSIADASMAEGNSGTTILTFTVTLTEQANGNVTVDYATSDGTATGGVSCGAGVDYVTAAGTLPIAGGTTTGTVDVTVCGDTDSEPDETFTVTLANISANATLGTAAATGTIANDDAGGLNDTGITLCGDYAWGGSGSDIHNNDVDCAAAGATATVPGTETANGNDPVPAGQDAHFGRDANPLTNDDTDGHAGFSFTKLDASGNPLADQSVDYATTPWYCVQDNVTGLMWEVKTDDGGLHHKDWTYTWYNSDAATNGGSVGAAAGGACGGTVAAGCDTEKYVAAVNAAGLCGANDWRLPTADELQSLVHYGRTSPAIDTGFFPNTLASWFWSSSPSASDSGSAWDVVFVTGDVNAGYKSSTGRVRLVRAGQ
ncbi:MAG: DUF1566 domain-containing protein [Gammaproteobacteria bacterium]|nr:DUF1566 domain-containing protein [Gammaproteobacteria bacterium]